IAPHFDVVIWRSLVNAPDAAEIQAQWRRRVAGAAMVEPPPDPDAQAEYLFTHLTQQRCLLVLDNLESVMGAGTDAGRFPARFHGYTRLIRQFAERAHNSLLLITSREQPQICARLERAGLPLRTVEVAGMRPDASELLLRQSGVSGVSGDLQRLAAYYSGNPLALLLAAEAIHDLFGGAVAEYLQTESGVFDDVRILLDQHFARLGSVEEAIMMWLALAREPVAIQTLAAQISPPISTAAVMGALRSLQRRALVERRGGGFTLQNVVMEYTTDRLVQSLQTEILGAPLHFLANHALVKMRAKEYIRSIQERLILIPLADALVAHAGRVGAVTRLRRLLDDVRGHTAWSSSYAAGNILNVLRSIEGSLHDLDVSGLTVRDLNLRDTHVEHVNFAGATIKDAAFSQQFGHILRISYHPDGGTIAARTGDEEIRIWRTTDGQLTGAFTMPSNLIFPVLYSPDGRLLLAGGAHTDLILCDADSCETRLVLRGHRHRVWDAAFSADGRYLATASADQTVRIWDPQTGPCVHELRGHDHAVMALAVHPDGAGLIPAADDGRTQLWNVHDGTAEDGWTTTPGLRALALHPDGALLATGGTDGALTLWEGTSGRIRAHLPAHAAGVSALAFDATGALLASAGEAGAIRLWDVETTRVRAVLEGHTAAVGHLAFHPHLSQLASAGWDRTLRIWDSQSAQPLMTLYGLRAGVRALAFAPDAQRLYSGSDDGSVYAWPVADFMAGGSGATDRTARDSTPDDLAGLPAAISGVVCTPDQRGLILGCWDNTVRIMDLATRAIVGTARWPLESTWSTAVNATGRWLATGSRIGIVPVWSLPEMRLYQQFEGHSGRVKSVAFHPTLPLLASASADETVRIWDLEGSARHQVLRGHTKSLMAVAYSPDGRFLATAGQDRTIRLWDAATGVHLHTLHGHTNTIFALAFHPHGHLLASAAEDQTIRMWDMDAGAAIPWGRVAPIGSPIWSLAFSHDGRLLASGSSGEHIHLWHVAQGDLLGTVRIPRPYQDVTITDVHGLTAAQRAALRELGATDRMPRHTTHPTGA
ncbi:MAG: hypothetical protein KDE20_12820, partial [Caldilineaceae bacterium]|nr:hypothetical protein [Caldilineaceae bacterium]